MRRHARPPPVTRSASHNHRFFTKRRKAYESLRKLQDAFPSRAEVRRDGRHHLHECGRAGRAGRPGDVARRVPPRERGLAQIGRRRHGHEVRGPAPPFAWASSPRAGLPGACGSPRRACAGTLGRAASRRPVARTSSSCSWTCPCGCQAAADGGSPSSAAVGFARARARTRARVARSCRVPLRRRLSFAIPCRQRDAARDAPSTRPPFVVAFVAEGVAAVASVAPSSTSRTRPQRGRGHADFRRPGSFRETVQAAPHQVGIHPSGRRVGARYAIWKRIFADDHMSVRSVTVELQEYVQAEAAAAKVVGGGGFDDGLADEHRQDRGAREEEEKAHEHRSVGEGSAGAALSQAAEAFGSGDHQLSGQFAVGEGSGACVVLQQATEGEADDSSEHTRRGHDGGHGGTDALRPSRVARESSGSSFALALALAPHAVPSGHGGPSARGALTVSLLGPARQTLLVPGR